MIDSLKKTPDVTAIMYKRRMQQTLRIIYDSAVSAVNGKNLVNTHVKFENNKLMVKEKSFSINQVYLVGFGKAVLGLAEEIENKLGTRLIKGILSVPFGSVETLKPKFKEDSVIEIRECARNNLPDKYSVENAERIRCLVENCGRDDTVIVLISGGGSACLSCPKPTLTLEDKLQTIKQLVKSGANIKELNAVRKQLSSVKGGKLALAARPATVISLVISDVVGNPLEDIASGPTVCNNEEFRARDVIVKYGIQDQLPQTVLKFLHEQANNQDPNLFTNVHNIILGDNNLALISAKSKAESLGYQTILLSNTIDCDGDDLCQSYVNLVQLVLGERRKIFEENNNLEILDNKIIMKKLNQILFHVNDVPESSKEQIITILSQRERLKLCILAGGEITWNMSNKTVGKGGRNLHLTLKLNQEIRKYHKQHLMDQIKTHVWFSSLGTDGIDGVTDVAGSVAYNFEEIDEAVVEKHLNNFDSCNYYYSSDLQEYVIRPGHTGTNVMDMHILIIEEE